MDHKYYCDSVQSELTGLKARAYDIIRQLEKMPNKDQLAPQMSELHALVDDLNVKIDSLRRECPSDWSSHKQDIDKQKAALLAKMNWWDEEHIAGGFVGG